MHSLTLTCEPMTLLLAPGDLREAQEAGEVSREPIRTAGPLPAAGLPWDTARAGWKNSAGRWNRGEATLLLLFPPPPPPPPDLVPPPPPPPAPPAWPSSCAPSVGEIWGSDD